MLTPLATVKMQTAMTTDAYSLDELVELTGLAKATVTRFVNELHAGKAVYVAGWARDGRDYPTIRKFKMGSLPDAACPVLYKNDAERMRIKRAAKKAVPA